MAKAASKQPSVDPEGQYRVVLSRPFQLGKRLLRPRDDVVVKGKVVTEMGDAVEKFEKV